MIEGKTLGGAGTRYRDIPFGGGGGGGAGDRPSGEVTDPQLIDNIGDNFN
jgi:hypothetical protein